MTKIEVKRMKHAFKHFNFCPFMLSTSKENISGNSTFTFLITLDKDLGELMLLKFYWESSAVWRNMWSQLQTIFTWSNQVEKPQLTLGKIGVKAGETQQR